MRLPYVQNIDCHGEARELLLGNGIESGIPQGTRQSILSKTCRREERKWW